MDKNKFDVGLIGVGNIGSELCRKVKSLDWNIKFILRSDGVYKDLSEKIDDLENYLDYVKDLDIAFLAIPTLDDGKTAYNYICSLVEKNIPVITCEKGALSNYFSELEGWIDKEKIGFGATVGGGTRMLEYLENMVNPKIEEIHAVVNGTLNYIFTEVASGRSLGEVVKETRKLGYAEPGAVTPLEVINKESTGDVPMKVAILYNVCFKRKGLSSEYMKAKDAQIYEIDEMVLKQLKKESNVRRFIISITKEKSEEDMIGGFRYEVDEWVISAGFKNIYENPLFKRLVPSGVNNALLISEGKDGEDGIYTLNGPGAGAEPTTSSMIKDAKKLLLK